jgi:RNA polymerase sigma-70 factor, ECF subfamily
MPLTSRVAAASSSFDQLVGPWIEPGYRLAVAMLADPDEAQDAVQEAAINAWRSLDRLREPEQARTWFLSIVANRCRSIARRHWWTRGRNPLVASATSGPEDQIVRATDIARGMGRLAPDDRAALLLRFYLDLPVAHVGRALGISEAAARSRIYRAADRLRPALTEDDVR